MALGPGSGNTVSIKSGVKGNLLHAFLLAAFAFTFVTQGLAETGSCLERTIPVNVYTERGEVASGLTPADFKASIGGKPVLVSDATYDNGPRRIVLLIDVSGSMTMEGGLQWGLEFVQDLISLASPQDSLALLTFSHRIEDSIAFGESRPVLTSEIHKLQNTVWTQMRGVRNTALQDALGSAVAMLGNGRTGDVICLVSDGGENASQARKSTAEDRLVASNARLFTFLPRLPISSRTRTPEEEFAPEEMRDLAAATGGDLVVYVPIQVRLQSFPTSPYVLLANSDRQEIRRASQALYREISVFYQLKMRLPEPVARRREWALKVVDSSGHPNNHLLIIYPHRLAPCVTDKAP